MTATINLNPRELLSRLADSNSSGCLEFDGELISWKIYLQQGSLQYVCCSAQLLEELKYYLHYLGWKQAAVALKQLPTSYLKIPSSLQENSSQENLYSKAISWLVTEKYLEPSQGLELIEHMTKDALKSCLWIDNGTFVWHEGEAIPLWIQECLGSPSSLDILEYLNLEQVKLKQWQNCSVQLLSVHQRPYFTSGWEQKSLPTSGSLDRKVLKELTQVIKGRTSIRQLSLLLQKNELQIAQILSPYIEAKIIYLRNPQPPLDRLPGIPRPATIVANSASVVSVTNSKNENTISGSADSQKSKLVCIDDSPTILKEIQRFLDREKFEITAINDPVQAVSIIFRIKPDLILLDITMPKINGYKLCSLLRSSDYCNNTPIIMVTGNTGLIDKARARLAGATDYFTKPFTKQELTQIVNKYLN